MKCSSKHLFASVFALTLSANLAHADLLTNGDFEAGNLSGWSAFGGAPQSAQGAGWAASEGTYGFWMHGWNSNVDGGISQNVAATPGVTYTLAGDWKAEVNFAPANGTGEVDVSLIFLDVSNTELSKHTATLSGSTGFVAFPSISKVADAGTTSVTVEIHWTTGDQTIGSTSHRSAFVDNLVLVPEPGSLALLGLGGLLVARRRR